MSIGKRIKELRLSRSLTLPELSSKASISLGMLSMIENDKRDPTRKTLSKISAVLDTTTEYLLTGETKSIIDSFIDSLVSAGIITGKGVIIDDALRTQILTLVESEIRLREEQIKKDK